MEETGRSQWRQASLYQAVVQEEKKAEWRTGSVSGFITKSMVVLI
jgi:hypothetical protein